jgi:serine/threonine protein kinase
VDSEVVRRFEQEVKTASILKHAAAVPIYDSGIYKTGQPFLVMELVEGQTLAEMLKQGSGLEWRRAVKLFVQVCACLGAAHEKGIVHRDLKPGNLMIATDLSGQELVRVLDFGIAKVLPVQGETFQRLTQSGEMLGTLLYMSPEQCLDEDLDGRSDIYSLGCLMYETFTGKPPLCGRTAFETMNKHMSDMPERLSRVRPDLNLPQDLEVIIFKSLAKKRDHRYQAIGEVEDALQSSLRNTVGTQIRSANVASHQVSTDHAALPIVSTSSGLAAIALQKARDLNWAGTKIAYIFGFITVAVIFGLVILHWNIALWSLVPILVMFCFAPSVLGSDVQKIERVSAVLSNNQPQRMLIRKVDGNSEQSNTVGVTLQTDDISNRSILQLTINTYPAGPFWDSLAMASQLEDLASRNIPADVYTDPATKQPVAVFVKGQLFFL